MQTPHNLQHCPHKHTATPRSPPNTPPPPFSLPLSHNSTGDSAAQIVEEQRGKGSYLLVPPKTFLGVKTGLFANGGGTRINRYVVLLDVKVDLSKLEGPVALYEPSWPDLAGSEADIGCVAI